MNSTSTAESQDELPPELDPVPLVKQAVGVAKVALGAAAALGTKAPPRNDPYLEAALLQGHESSATQASGAPPAPALPTRPASLPQTPERVVPARPPPLPMARTVVDVLAVAKSRIAALVLEARAQREQGTAEYARSGEPLPPRDSARRDVLAKGIQPAPRGSIARDKHPTLGFFDRSVTTICRDVLENPLWLAADHVDRRTKFDRIDEHVQTDARVIAAQGKRAQAESAFVRVNRKLERFQQRSKVHQVIANALTNAEARLLAAKDGAAEQLLDADKHFERIQRDVRFEQDTIVAERNAHARTRQTEAQTRRDELEQPLREALLQRYVAEQALAGQRASQHLQHAPDGAPLTYQGKVRIGTFAFHELETASGQTYLGDAVDLKASFGPLKLARGDQVVLRTYDGERRVEVSERSSVLSLADAIERGVSGAVTKLDNSKGYAEAFRLTDEGGGHVWVRTDKPEPGVTGLELGDHISLNPRGGVVRTAPSLGQAR